MWCVKCCGCDRLMTRDGSPGQRYPTSFLEVKGKGKGKGSRQKAVFVPGRNLTPEEAGLIADFQTKADADSFARKHGWQTEDPDGENHRCPECLRSEMEAPRGAHVWIDLPQSANAGNPRTIPESPEERQKQKP
jgi:hypothetical protein